MKKIYTSVDIGSDSIKVVVLELFRNRLNLLAASSTKSAGVRKGVITNPTAATTALKTAISDVEAMLGVKIRKVLASVPAQYAEYIYAKAKIEIKREDNIINSEDINHVLKESITGRIIPDHELVSILPIDFTLDERAGIKDPKGLSGISLECRSMIITTPKKNVYSVVSLIEEAGYEVIDISVNGTGDGYAFRNKDNLLEAGAIINIGAEVTTVSIYNRGIIVKGETYPLGGRNIDSDLAYIFKLSLNNACKLKEKFAVAHRRYASSNDIKEIENINGETIKINQYELSEVVMSRIEEILELAKKEIYSLTNKQMQYIIITGGSSHLFNLHSLAEEVIDKIVQIGDVKVLGARNNRYSSAIGNVVYFINKLNLRGRNYSMFNISEQEALAEVKRYEILGSSALGRIFGFFTNE